MRYIVRISTIFLTFLSSGLFAQEIVPYSYHLYQRINSKLYNLDTRFHTSVRPSLQDDSLLVKYIDSAMAVGAEKKYNSWGGRKLFNEHLLDIRKEDYTFYADFLPDFSISRDIEHNLTPWNNTRGFQLGGSIGKQFKFYASGFENQTRFNDYLTRYINKTGVIPNYTNDNFGTRFTTKDWSYATAILDYAPSKYVSFTLGSDKNFIGDGYRSMLLSDVASPYPFFKVTATVGDVKYMAMWSQFQDPLSEQFSYDNGYRKKWGVFHYLDWNVTNRLSLGFFDAIIWQDADSVGKRGFDPTYLNPILFLRPVERMNGSPDNAFLGFNAKYKLFSNVTIYGQFAADEFTAKEVFKGDGYWANKFAYQLGVKGFDAFKVSGLNYLAEFNTARPFTYSHKSSLSNYGHYAEALANPLGANFRELLTIWNYRIGRFDFYGQANYANYGLDVNGENFGKDINRSNQDYRLRASGYKTSGGLKTDFYYLDGRVSYIINPKYNLRLEVGGIYRQETNSLTNDKTTMLTVGLRSTFRNFYRDF